jgi:hypothetical protein
MATGLRAWLSEKLARSGPEPATIAATARKPAEPFHAVSVKAGAESCEGAKQLAGLRFLSASAPRLPLPNCTDGTCTCYYVHHTDRRSGIDRRTAEKWRQTNVTGNERRQRKQGRRVNDSIL